ncbi:Homeodomain-like protein [Choanephora cucurbitarum]|nr:Homeodomain-like protein [Choanephora cucurbitarum]
MSTNLVDNKSFSVFKHTGGSQFYCRWTEEEDRLLSKAVKDHGPHKWTTISHFIPGRTAVQCSTRWFGALNPNIHKGRWVEHEDQALIKAVHYYQSIHPEGHLPWNKIAEHIPHRTGIQCQARWSEALNPKVRKGRWHADEDTLLREAIAKYGCCWIRVASMIPTRTQRQCRTRYNQIRSQQLKRTSRSFSRTEKGGFLVENELTNPVKPSSKARESIIVPFPSVPNEQQTFSLSPPSPSSSSPSSTISPYVPSYPSQSFEGWMTPKEEDKTVLFPSTLTLDNTMPMNMVDIRHNPYTLPSNDFDLFIGFI